MSEIGMYKTFVCAQGVNLTIGPSDRLVGSSDRFDPIALQLYIPQCSTGSWPTTRKATSWRCSRCVLPLAIIHPSRGGGCVLTPALATPMHLLINHTPTYQAQAEAARLRAAYVALAHERGLEAQKAEALKKAARETRDRCVEGLLVAARDMTAREAAARRAEASAKAAMALARTTAAERRTADGGDRKGEGKGAVAAEPAVQEERQPAAEEQGQVVVTPSPPPLAPPQQPPPPPRVHTLFHTVMELEETLLLRVRRGRKDGCHAVRHLNPGPTLPSIHSKTCLNTDPAHFPITLACRCSPSSPPRTCWRPPRSASPSTAACAPSLGTGGRTALLLLLHRQQQQRPMPPAVAATVAAASAAARPRPLPASSGSTAACLVAAAVAAVAGEAARASPSQP